MGEVEICAAGLRKGALAASLMMEYVLQLLQRDVTRGVTGTILLKVGSGGLAFAMFSLAARTLSPEASGANPRCCRCPSSRSWLSTPASCWEVKSHARLSAFSWAREIGNSSGA